MKERTNLDLKRFVRQLTKHKTYPVVRLAIMVMKGRKKVRAPGAVILMELGKGKGSARSHVKYFAVLCEGEW